MNEFYGDLLMIGGDRLKHVRGELAEEQPSADSTDWNLAGRLHLPPGQCGLLQSARPYRLQLEDGRAGQVMVSRIVSASDDALLVDFQPGASPKPK